MIEHKTGDILEEDAEALVNTVNCDGFMGRGVALKFKKAYKDNFEAYAAACEDNKIQPGKMFVFKLEEKGLEKSQSEMFDLNPSSRSDTPTPRYIINFPTKLRWRRPSRIEYIEDGLVDLVEKIKSLKLRSIAIPALGCGNGGLEWEKVRPLIEQAVQDFRDVQISIFNPKDPSEN